MTIDAPIIVEISGELDGKAVIFFPNGPQDSKGLPLLRNGIYDSSNIIILLKGEINKKVRIGEAVGNFQLIYQPITAKNGSLSINIDY